MRNRGTGGWLIGVGLLVGSGLVVGCINLGGGGGSSVVGSGPVVTEDREVAAFDKVDAGNGMAIVISIGAPQSVEVTAQQNIAPLVSTSVTDGKLTAVLTSSVTTTAPITITIVTPSLTGLALLNGTRANVTGIAADNFTLDADNGSHVNLDGTARALNVNASNGVLLELGSLVAMDATIAVANGVTGRIHATGTVSGTASSGVMLIVMGGATVNVDTSSGAIITSQ